MVPTPVVVRDLTLPAEPRSVAQARRAVRDSLAEAGGLALLDPAVLAVSELVTNAIVHVGTDVGLRVQASAVAVRVLVRDGNAHSPVPRSWSTTAGTGRGLHLVDESVDRWGTDVETDGKTVWFEIGSFDGVRPGAPGADRRTDDEPTDSRVDVVLRQVPLLMHWAWQEHASSLLREYLLVELEVDADAIDAHAHASMALTILHDQVPVPELPDDPEALMASAVEPGVTEDRLVLELAPDQVAHFVVLDALLTRARAAANDGLLLVPPTQPEIEEMRVWLCGEVVAQSGTGSAPRPWRARTDPRAPYADELAQEAPYRELAASPLALLATDEASVIVAVTPRLLAHLGYADAGMLLGRRILVVVPERFHQAHIAGTTLNATHGRDVLLDRPVTVPVVRADGSEVMATLQVSPRRLDADHRVFVATFELDPPLLS